MLALDELPALEAQFGSRARDEVVAQVVRLIRKDGRTIDFVGLSRGLLGLLLPNTPRKGAQIRLERLSRLIYDQEFKENDADFEACVPLKKAKAIAGADVRELVGGHGLTLTHKGPYNEVGPTYERLFKHAKEKGYRVVAPCREVYLKGPGMIFRGNPKNYITDVQILVEHA